MQSAQLRNRLKIGSTETNEPWQMLGRTKNILNTLAALTPMQRAALNEVNQMLRDRLPVERIVLYFPKDEGLGKNPSIIHLAVVTDHYPSSEEYRGALDIFNTVRAKHNVTVHSLFVSHQDWEDFFPIVAAFEEIRQQGIEVWRRA